MKIFIQNKGQINLTKANFLSSGGEGDVYVHGKLAYKIYHDIKKMIPVGKIQELSVLTDPNIIKPEDVLLDSRNNTIGYSMRYISDTYALCQLFTKVFKDRNNINQKTILNIIQSIQKIVQHAHDHNCLIVDLNELNFLVNKNFKEVYCIDVDSWQTKNYPATAIMESVRDHQVKNNKFTENSDWFSFGVVAFQLLESIHPYKGNYPTIKSLEERMEKNISVFDKNVSIPKICPPLETIPEAYRNWFKAVFADGKRLPPPKDLQAVANIVHTAVQKIVGSNNFKISELGEYVGDIINLIWSSSPLVLTTKECISGKAKLSINRTDIKLIMSEKNPSNILGAWIDNNKLVIKNLVSQKDIPLDLNANDLMTYDNRLYVKSGTNLLEIKLMEVGTNIIASPVIVANVLEHASSVFPGVIIQNLLGACYISIFPKSEEHHQIHIKELDKYKIVDAKYDSGILMVIGVLHGKYHKFIIRIDGDDSYDVRVENDISHTDLNFIVNDRGVCVHINHNDEVEVFSNRKGSSNIKKIQDDQVNGSIKLFYSNGLVLGADKNKIYSINMR